jgi:serine/threonine protein kinase
MELVTGGELFNRIVELGAYTEEMAVKVVRSLLDAVAYLHSLNIAHRDLKPTNLLLKSVDDDSDVKIADFGLSKILGENALMQTACGTPIYVAPEVLSGEAYEREVDLWSIGVIMYILLCGFPPFFNDGTDVGMLFDQIMTGTFEFPDPYWTNISDDAKNLIKQFLTVDPAKRPTAEEALKHPWIAGGGSAAKLDVKAKLKEFNSRRKAKK